MSSGGRRVLVVDDEPTIAGSIAARLRAEGYTVDVAHDGPSAIARFEADEPDLVVLDVMLPGFDGLEVCRRIQARRSVPVLMLTARDTETDLLVGLAVGADDYLTKPFSIRELAARVGVLFRRVDRAAELRGGEPAHLTPTEFDLLVHMARQPRTVHPREALLANVWGWADATATRAVDSHVKALRRKLGADLIRTVHGVGYALDVPR
jgi:DNA-binding response OmpR family regulator